MKLERKQVSRKRKLVSMLVMILLMVLFGILGFFWFSLHRVQHVEIDKSKEALGIHTSNDSKEETKEKEPAFQLYHDEIINVALFGLDRRDEKDTGRADATMILTVDFKHQKIKLASLMRDMYINIDGYGKTKFNHAYSYGGAPLAIKTINENFGTDIQDYVSVDFFTLEKIIDAIGGIDIEVTDEEYPLMNKYMNEVASIHGEEYTPLTMGGFQHLNGKQAVAYARIRKVGNGDFERTQRQRIVLTQMIEKISKMNKMELSKLVYQLLPYVETSMDTKTILDIGLNCLTKEIRNVEQDRFPRDGYWQAKTINHIWYMDFDLDSTKAQIQEFIYEPHQHEAESVINNDLSNEAKEGTNV